MAWTTRKYTKAAIDAAGEVLSSDDDLFVENDDPNQFWEKRQEAIAVVNNWRSCHSYPLNGFQVVLRRRARSIDRNPLLSQRIKRLAAIEFKLRERKRRNKPLPLSEMQDLGGCRAVLSSINHVRKLVNLYGEADTVHPLDWGNNYIDKPTFTGYRSQHFIYQYRGQKKHYRRMRIEIQIRTTLQHLWATAVRDGRNIPAPGAEIKPWRQTMATVLRANEHKTRRA
jgi:Region found in RelA / SpoT proteins